uniref:Ribosomal protein L5 n=1 Tax=Malawimonas jakobiformis TaxID=136089 RepID=Q9G893_MALJA|nr:ribosomal protein L5 [Malawimonas jakobiformis]AAG13680.1 ribosomal protein L5 [Malawimonas jakobiformis]
MIKKHYEKITRPDLILKNKYKNIMEIPSIKKISVNITVDSKNRVIEPLMVLELITGQKAKVLKAKKSISSFNLRKDMYIACKVTLQKKNMYNFINKLINIVLPKIREFKGFSVDNIDSQNNYTLSIKNMSIFPEIEYQFDIFNKIYGMDITIVTNSKNTQETRMLLTSLQLPLK